MLSYALAVLWCHLLLWGAYALLLGKGQRLQFNRRVLVASALLAPLLPLLNITHWLPPSQRFVLATQLEPVVSLFTAGREAGPINWSGFVLILWLSVSGLLLVQFAWRLRFIVRLIRRGERRHYHRHPVILTGGRLPTFVFLHYLFWDETVPFSKEQQRYIMEHELTHIRQAHGVDLLLLELLRIVFWFSPGVYGLRRELVDVHEYLADEAATELVDKRSYASILARGALQRLKVPLSNAFKKLRIHRRLQRLTRALPYLAPRRWGLLYLPAVFVIWASVQLPSLSMYLPYSDPGTTNKLGNWAKVVGHAPEGFTQAYPTIGWQAFYQQLGRNLQAYQPANQPTREVRFQIVMDIDAYGQVEQLQLAALTHDEYEAAILRSINEVETHWIPATAQGYVLAQRMVVPIRLRLEPKKPER